MNPVKTKLLQILFCLAFCSICCALYAQYFYPISETNTPDNTHNLSYDTRGQELETKRDLIDTYPDSPPRHLARYDDYDISILIFASLFVSILFLPNFITFFTIIGHFRILMLLTLVLEVTDFSPGILNFLTKRSYALFTFQQLPDGWFNLLGEMTKVKATINQPMTDNSYLKLDYYSASSAEVHYKLFTMIVYVIIAYISLLLLPYILYFIPGLIFKCLCQNERFSNKRREMNQLKKYREEQQEQELKERKKERIKRVKTILNDVEKKRRTKFTNSTATLINPYQGDEESSIEKEVSEVKDPIEENKEDDYIANQRDETTDNIISNKNVKTLFLNSDDIENYNSQNSGANNYRNRIEERKQSISIIHQEADQSNKKKNRKRRKSFPNVNPEQIGQIEIIKKITLKIGIRDLFYSLKETLYCWTAIIDIFIRFVIESYFSVMLISLYEIKHFLGSSKGQTTSLYIAFGILGFYLVLFLCIMVTFALYLAPNSKFVKGLQLDGYLRLLFYKIKKNPMSKSYYTMNMIRIKLMICFVIFSGLKPLPLLLILLIVQGCYIGQLIAYSKFSSFLLNLNECIIEISVFASIIFMSAFYKSDDWEDENSFISELFAWTILGCIIIAIIIQIFNLIYSYLRFFRVKFSKKEKEEGVKLGEMKIIIEHPSFKVPPRKQNSLLNAKVILKVNKAPTVYSSLEPTLGSCPNFIRMKDSGSYRKRSQGGSSKSTEKRLVSNLKLQKSHKTERQLGENDIVVHLPDKFFNKPFSVKIDCGKKTKEVRKTIVRRFKSAPKRKKKMFKELKKLRKSIIKQEEAEQKTVRLNKSRKSSKIQPRKKSSKKIKSTNKHWIKRQFSTNKRHLARGRGTRRKENSKKKKLDTQYSEHSERMENSSPESPPNNHEENKLEARFESESSIFQLGPEHFQNFPNDRVDREREDEERESKRKKAKSKIDLANCNDDEKVGFLKAFNQTTERRSSKVNYRKNASKKIDLQNKSVDPHVRYMRYENKHKINRYLKEETKDDKYNNESSISTQSKKTPSKFRNDNSRATKGAVLKAAGKSIFNPDLSLHSKYESAEDHSAKGNGKNSLGLFIPKKGSGDNY
ncbi:unnamed protein product [Moneuplotes crassus]|uniref:Uncharacterized protein n=1 Tax=Euplotes crassus TaxID=5936 RepID=A0AAD1Y9N5_EUPCR|nr:unnamed protein product [Moneuplotes crassus]